MPSPTSASCYAVGGGESGYIAVDPRDYNIVYTGNYGGLLTRINRRTGERRAINIWPDNPMGFSGVGHHRAIPVDVSAQGEEGKRPASAVLVGPHLSSAT